MLDLRIGAAAGRGLAAAAVLAAALLGAGVPAGGPAWAQSRAPETFADLAEKLSPAVVNISTSQTVDQPDREIPGIPPGTLPEDFRDLFRDFFERGFPQGPREVQSLGSGFVVSPEGFVVTNNHVIEDADEITVNFSDGKSLPAELIGNDPKTDIALLKVEPTAPLTFVEFGDSDAIRVGDWVLAIGNPFGLGGSVSAGIVSARNRDINAGPYDDFIQTDAAINRGNSGGPLFNMGGKVIGVNTAIISPTGGSVGIGFSVPSNIVANVVAQLREHGQTRRGWLGVHIQTVSDEIAEALGLESAKGALVSDVAPDGPAAAAGIKAGDVIVNFDGRDVTEMRSLPRMVADTPVGKSVRVVIFRDGKTQTVKVELGLLEEQADAAPGIVEPDEPAPATELAGVGLRLAPITDVARQQYGLPESVEGVLVAEVARDSEAARKGIAPGDVIIEVQQTPVATPADVADRVEDAKAAGRKSALFLIQTGADMPRFVPLAVGD
ncbi:DegQ family serine endoprotease [Limibaculum sp. M0105]|uniref:Probable periplasmic serine endoprotease DegP-like n=1 Tax=Thermohalobaculum xanthum TaxID=2753746 RepID=A0A8J7SG57_9RHOB|nr:DegQ family serine endoprotease [Thermohalobaculum xanthum]MBK0400828.1 DegQ family serine endoprotease [Thermohalobaculum xanthum]